MPCSETTLGDVILSPIGVDQASVFVGSLWSVYDKAAYEFAQSFYASLLTGKPVGQAVKEARAAIRPLNDPSWLAYTVFADPLAVVK